MRIPSPKNSPQIKRMEITCPLHDYIYKNDVKNVKAKINETDVNVTDSKGRTALFLAASFNRFELIDILLTSGCDVNVSDPLGNTPLHEASEKGNADVVNLLVSHSNCDPDARNHDGETPLMKAAYYDYGEIVRLLLKAGADPDTEDNSGQTALLIALRESSNATVDHLLKHGCDVSVTDKLGHSALYIAIHSVCNKSLDLAKTLLGSGYDITRDKEWLLHEEKHNLFYQDDEFYNRLCKILTNNSLKSMSMRSTTTYDSTPPLSPALRQRKLATVTDLPPLRTPNSPLIDRKPSNSSPFLMRKSSNTSNGASPSFSTMSHYFNTPPSSPTIAARKISGTSCQNEAPTSPLIRMRRMTPCPPPTENMLGSPKLAPKLNIRRTAPSSPVEIRRKTSQTSPLAKSNSSALSSSYSPLSSPESSTPSSPLVERKISQTASGKHFTSALVKGRDDVAKRVVEFDKVTQRLQEKRSASTSDKLTSSCPNLAHASPSLKQIIKQGSLDSASPPGSPNTVYKRQIDVKVNVKGNDDQACSCTMQRQMSVPSKTSVKFSANVEVIDVHNN